MIKIPKFIDDNTHVPSQFKRSKNKASGFHTLELKNPSKPIQGDIYIYKPGSSDNKLKKWIVTGDSNDLLPAVNKTNSSTKIPDFELNPSQSVGSVIKNNVKTALSKKYGELDIKNIFDDIDDADVEKNISTAETTIKNNIDRGFLRENEFTKYPYMRDGLAVWYAAADKGNNRAATKAREAAYMENDGLLIKDTGRKWLSTEKPKFTKYASEITKVANTKDDKSRESKREIPENIQGVRLKAMMQNKNDNSRYVNADVLNMRSAPGTGSSVIGNLTNGTEVKYTGNKTDEINGHLWAEVTHDGKTGWVAADYLNVAKPQNSSFDTSRNDLNIIEDEDKKSTHSNNNSSIYDELYDGNIQINSDNAQNDFEVKMKGNKQRLDWENPSDVRNEFNKVGKHGNMECADLSKWVIDEFTDLKRPASNNNGNVFAQNIADLNGLSTTHTPCAPAIFSVKEGTYGPGIKPGSVSHSKYGHTGIILSVKELDNDMYELTYMDTYRGYNKDGYNSNVNTRTFKKSDNVTYVSLEGKLK